MSAAKHTPGIGREGGCLFEIDPSGARNLWSGHLHPNNGYSPDHVERALALFTAAPDLLKALEAFVADIAPNDPNDRLWASARAAIAKATGSK